MKSSSTRIPNEHEPGSIIPEVLLIINGGSQPLLNQDYGICYAGTLCTALSSHLDYEKCQATLQDGS